MNTIGAIVRKKSDQIVRILDIRKQYNVLDVIIKVTKVDDNRLIKIARYNKLMRKKFRRTTIKNEQE